MRVKIAGFGGQGILFAGKFLAYIALYNGKEVSWLPAYGPEMRGGTANCSVVFDDAPIASPLIDEADVIVVMNGPSMEKFAPIVAPGGLIFSDETLVQVGCGRDDVELITIPATGLADKHGFRGLANMVMMGKLVARLALCGPDVLEAAMRQCIPERKADMFEANMKALKLGMEY